MEQLLKAQQNAIKATAMCIALNKLLADMMSSDVQLHDFVEKATQFGCMAGDLADTLGAIAGYASKGVEERTRQLMGAREDYF